MGIKFHCPNGHKLHVKSFLAGKKGVCPECGIKIVIPEQSEPHRSRQTHRDENVAALAGAANQGVAATIAGTVGGTMPAMSPPASVSPVGAAQQAMPTRNSPTTPHPATPHPATPHPTQSSPMPAPVPTGAVPTPAYNPQSMNPAAAMPMAYGTSPAMGMPAMGMPVAGTPVTGTPVGAAVGVHNVPMGMHAQPAAPSMHAPVMGMPVGQPQGIPAGAYPAAVANPMMGSMATAVAAPTHTPDPIDENPNATWYVRPPSGGQYGPARGDVMRKWIGEGRVSADSLVWREGWTDWLSANAVFPSLNAGAAEGPSSPAAPFLANAPAAGGKSTKRKTSSRSRGPSAGTAVAIVIFLALMAVGLLIALFYVLNQTQHSSHKRSNPQHAAARCIEPWRVL